MANDRKMNPYGVPLTETTRLRTGSKRDRLSWNSSCPKGQNYRNIKSSASHFFLKSFVTSSRHCSSNHFELLREQEAYTRYPMEAHACDLNGLKCIVLEKHSVRLVTEIVHRNSLPSHFILSAPWTKTAMMELRSCRRFRF